MLADMGCVSPFTTVRDIVFVPRPTKACILTDCRFGIMLGTAFNLAFYHVPDSSGIVGLNWRLMLAVPCIPAFLVMVAAYMNPESPRWLMQKRRYSDALRSLQTLRNSDLQAARDLYYMHTLLQQEEEVLLSKKSHGPAILQLFRTRRNRNAVIGSFIVMFAQQFCGQSCREHAR